MKKLKLEGLQDPLARDNFSTLQDEAENDTIKLTGFKFLTFTVPGAVTDYPIPHSLKARPMDIIVSYTKPAVTVSFNHDKNTDETLYVTTSGATTVRCFVGRYAG